MRHSQLLLSRPGTYVNIEDTRPRELLGVTLLSQPADKSGSILPQVEIASVVAALGSSIQNVENNFFLRKIVEIAAPTLSRSGPQLSHTDLHSTAVQLAHLVKKKQAMNILDADDTMG